MLHIVQGAAFFVALLGASICDLRRHEIPNIFPALIALTGLINFSPVKLFGLVLALPFYIAACCEESSMGGGDIKLVAACGFLLGLPAGTLGLIIGLTATLLFHGALRLFHWEHRSYPLAPFLSIGFSAAFFIQGGIL